MNNREYLANASAAPPTRPVAPSGPFPQGGLTPTKPGPYWFHQQGEELRAIQTAAGIAPSGAVLTQLIQAIKRLCGSNITTVNFADSPFNLTADHAGLVLIDATGGNVVVNLPEANVVTAVPIEYGFVRVDATANTATVDAAGADTIGGVSDFTLVSQYSNRSIRSNAVDAWLTLAASVVTSNSSAIQPITATVAASALTLGHAGGLPISYRNAALTSGAVSTITGGALSLGVPSGATLGSIAATPFRVWLAKVLDAGVEYLACMNTQIVNGINVDIAPVNESGVISTVAIGPASDSAGVWYSDAARANCPFRLVGYVDLEQAVPGTYATDPAVIQGMSAGVKKPGELVQRVVLQNATYSASSGTVAANDVAMLVTGGSMLHTKSFTPSSGVNLIKGNLSGSFGPHTSGGVNTLGVFDGSVLKRSATAKYFDSADHMTMALDFCYQALTTAARTIQSRFASSLTAAYANGNSAARIGGGGQAAVMTIEEIQA